MRVIKLRIEVTNEQLAAFEEYLGGEEALLDELEEAARARLRELRELIEPTKEEESQPVNAD